MKDLTVTITPAHGAKCARCWRYTRCWPHECFTDLGAICGRCREVVDGMLEGGYLEPNHPPVRPAPPEAPCVRCDGPCEATQ